MAELQAFLAPLTQVQVLAAGGAVGALLAALVIWLASRGRAKRDEAERRRYFALARRAREILAAAPDGLFLWDGESGGISCSKRLVEMLDLPTDPKPRYDDIRGHFEGESLKKLEQAVSLLRGKGTSFDIVLTSGERTFQAVGARAEDEDGETLADAVWMRDVTALARTAGPRNGSGLEDRHLTALLDSLPLPLWIRDRNLDIAFVNHAGEALEPPAAETATAAREEAVAISATRVLRHQAGETPWRITEAPLGSKIGGGTIGYAVPVPETPPGDARPQDVAPPGVQARELIAPLESAVGVFDADGLLDLHNPAFAALWGLEEEWLRGRPHIGELLDRLRDRRRLPEVADFREFRRAEIERIAIQGTPQEELMHLPDGRTLRRRTGQAGPDGLYHVYDDVSDRLGLERSVNELSRVQKTTIDNLHEGIAVFGADGRLKLSNPSFVELWGMDGEPPADDSHLAQILERMRPLLPAPEGWETRKTTIAEAILDRRTQTGRVELTNGRAYDYANVPLPDGAVLVSYMDITDSFRVERALRQRAEALAEADRLKSEFIANVSYEVRTPLTSIVGFAEMLTQNYFGELNRRQGEYASAILETARGLFDVVADITDLATIEAGRLELDRDTLDLHTLLVDAFELIRERARRKQVKLSFDCPPGIGWMVGDQRRLKQVVFNLLSNAVTFTPPRGTVTLDARRDGDDIVVHVADTGVAIPEADRERVFQPFHRGTTPEGEPEGAGLGLTVVRSFIELHGGSVAIGANRDRGTTVSLRLPADGGQAADGRPAETQAAQEETTGTEPAAE